MQRRDGDAVFIHRREIGIRPGIVFIARRPIQYTRPARIFLGLLLSAGWRLPQRVTRMPLICANGADPDIHVENTPGTQRSG